MESALGLFEKLGICGHLTNITAGHQVMSVLQGGHNILRKMANFRMTTHPNLSLNATVTCDNQCHNITYQDVTNIMKNMATTNELEYTQSNRTDNNHWYGIANPLFNILSAFKMRYDEIKVGV